MNQPLHLITDLVVHRLIKQADEPARIVLRPAVCEPVAAALALVERLCTVYRDRASKGYGCFDEEGATGMVADLREHIIERRVDFLGFSQRMMQRLQIHADEDNLAEGGFVLIARLREGDNDCLWVALLTETAGSGISAELEIGERVYIDFANLRTAGRIDLGGWQRGDERYISFLKGRGELAPYFKRFLGCDDVVIARKETQKLVHTLTRFAETERLEPPVRDGLMERAHLYLDELGECGAPLSVNAMVREVWPSAPERLDAVLNDAAAPVASGFVPDRRALKPLVRFKASAEQWKLEFDRSSLRSGAVTYDPDSGTLVLSNLPDYLKRMLAEE